MNAAAGWHSSVSNALICLIFESVPVELSQRFSDVIVSVGVACEDRLLPRFVLEREVNDRAADQRHCVSEAAVGNVNPGFEFDEPIDGLACSELLDIASLQRSGGQRVEYSHSQLVVGPSDPSALGWNREAVFIPHQQQAIMLYHPLDSRFRRSSERLSRSNSTTTLGSVFFFESSDFDRPIRNIRGRMAHVDCLAAEFSRCIAARTDGDIYVA